MTVVRLNIGGCIFPTRMSTIMEANTFFSSLVRHEDPIFVDRDPTHFRHILNWLRGVRYLPEDDTILSELLFEADYYCMLDMVQAIHATRGTHPPINRTLQEICRNMSHA